MFEAPTTYGYTLAMFKTLSVGRLLLAVASQNELEAVFSGLGLALEDIPASWQSLDLDSVTILHTGVGKTNAAGAVSRELTIAEGDGSQYGHVLSVGLAGSYDHSIDLAEAVLGLDHVLLDEGTISDGGWVTLERAGWARTVIRANPGKLFKQIASTVKHQGNIGTVSTISGTDRKMEIYKKRFEVMLEVMESAAIAEVCDKFMVEYVDLRVVSNYCGSRSPETHDFPKALKKLAELVSRF